MKERKSPIRIIIEIPDNSTLKNDFKSACARDEVFMKDKAVELIEKYTYGKRN